MLRATLRAKPRFSFPQPPVRRLVSTAPPAPANAPAAAASNGLRSAIIGTALVAGTGALLYYTHDSRAGIYRWVVLPATRVVTKNNAELAHELALMVVASGIGPVDMGTDDEVLAMELFGKTYTNPVGIAAGFDKNGEAIDGLFKLGFGYVEIGSVTPEPQPGNPKPRLFRVLDTESLINRYGFNSEGHAAVLARLRTRITNWVSSYAPALPAALFPPPPPHSSPNYDVVGALLASPAGSAATIPDTVGLPRSLHPNQVLAINLGKNKTSDPDSIDDFVNGVKTLGPYADVLVINVSSPNTPGLRTLQRRGVVEDLLRGVLVARDALPGPIHPPVLVKIAPDLDDEELADIGLAVLASGADGIIVSNTTISRPASAGTSLVLKETGGLSGPPVKPLALKALRKLREVTEGKVPLIGCGGIASGADAVEFAKAGASLVQLYTSMVYEGYGVPRRIKDEVAEILKSEGSTWKGIVGEDARKAKEAAEREVAETRRREKAEEESRLSDVKRLAEEGRLDGEFEKGLVEAQRELEGLLAELAQIEGPTPIPAAGAESTPVEVVEVIEVFEVPATAVLDESAIATLLDPARPQVEAGLLEKGPEAPTVEAEAEVPKVVDALKVDIDGKAPAGKGEAKRWV